MSDQTPILWVVGMVVLAVISGLIGYFVAKPIYSNLCPATNCPPCDPAAESVCAECKTAASCSKWTQSEWPTVVTQQAPKSDTGDDNYYVCAVRDGGCVAPVGTPIYFGVDGQYVKREATQTVTPCTVASFGSDPVAGKDKACWVPRSYPPPPTSFEKNPNFYKCASEGAACVVPVATPIFFGAQGQFVRLDASNSSTPCSAAAFGRDPLPGVTKACYVPR